MRPESECCQASCSPSRPSAVTVIRTRARQMRDEASSLEKLADRIDMIGLDPGAEQALFNMAVRQ